jgi:hypothetical protein
MSAYTPLLLEVLKTLDKKLGTYPHAALDPSEGIKKQSTRLLKVECEACGYTVRVTRKWLDEAGSPLCPCNEKPMTEEV